MSISTPTAPDKGGRNEDPVTGNQNKVPQRTEINASDKAYWLAKGLGYDGPAAETYQVCCPAHDDTQPSMSLTTGNEAEIVWHCHAECDQDDVRNVLIEMDLWPVPDNLATIPATQPPSSDQKDSPADEWVPQEDIGPLTEVPWIQKLGLMTGFHRYTREDGKLAYAICRYAKKDGGKEIRPYTWCRNTATGEEAWRLRKPCNLIPYRLFEISRSRKLLPFAIVEGEKTADAAAELLKGQFHVTTWFGGTKAVQKTDWTRLLALAEGQPIVLFPDNDATGLKAMEKLAEHLRSLGATNVIVRPLPAELRKRLKRGWDLADWTLGELVELPDVKSVVEFLKPEAVPTEDAYVSEVPPSQPSHAEDTSSKAAAGTFTASQLMDMQLPPVQWIVPSLLPEGLTLFAGRPKVGKSWVSLHLATELALGGTIFGSFDVEPSEVLYIALEDGQRRLQDRLKIVLGGRTAPDGLRLKLDLARLDKGGVDELRSFLDAHPATCLVVIDTYGKVTRSKSTGDLFQDDYRSLSELQDIAIEKNISIILVHHLRKPHSTGRGDIMDEIVGTTGLTAAADTLWALEGAGESLDAGVNLHARGRDIEGRNVHLDVDVAKGRWHITGDAIQTKRSPERQGIAKVLREANGEVLSPKEIAKRMGIEDEKGQANVRQLLSSMRKAGEIGHPKTGGYTHHSDHNDHSDHDDPVLIGDLMKGNFDDV